VNAVELPEKVRSFIAIYPPDSVIAKVEAAQTQLRTLIADRAVRWTKREQIHLTLQFLGSIERTRLNAFQSVLEHVSSAIKSFQIRGETIGCFPSNKHPGIIWVGLAGELNPLQSVKEKLDDALGELGYVPEEREFHPHLTIGRVAKLKTSDAQRLAKGILKFERVQFGEWPVREIHLMQSVLSPKGAVYQILKSFPLKTI
jgi:2'-5' RNA ligase